MVSCFEHFRNERVPEAQFMFLGLVIVHGLSLGEYMYDTTATSITAELLIDMDHRLIDVPLPLVPGSMIPTEVDYSKAQGNILVEHSRLYVS